MTSDPMDVVAAEALLRRFEVEAAQPASVDAAWLRGWVRELRRLDAFAAGLVAGRGPSPGLGEVGLSAFGLILGIWDFGGISGAIGLGLGWVGLFLGLGAWVRAVRDAQAALALQHRVHRAATLLDALSQARP